MEKEVELFDKKFVHFMWNDELEGKKCFVSDSIDILINAVNKGIFNTATINRSIGRGYALHSNETGNDYAFAYYDPNYEAKKAFNEGKKVQYQLVGGVDWGDIDSEEALECRIAEGRTFRIKPEEEKWVAYLARDEAKPYLTACREDIWNHAQKGQGAKTKLFVGSAVEAIAWYEAKQQLAPLIKAWEDGKTIQVYETLFNKWSDCAGTLEWYTDCEYRVKPECPCEDGIDSKACVGCEHSEDGKPHTFENYHCYICDKSDKKYRPYESSAEMIADFIARFKVNCPPYEEPSIWIKGKENDNRFLLTGFSPEVGVCTRENVHSSFNTLFNWYTYLDGSPCGKEC